jgi:uncharacterized membrane protein (UPF0127 family)
MRLKYLVVAAVLALAACSSHPADSAQGPAKAASPAVHPVSGLAVIPLTVTHSGKKLAFRVEVAKTAPEQAKGLMFRTAMGADEGMIFPMDPPRDAAFWMRNTVIPLDIIFIGTDRRISNIAANAVPYSEEALPSVGSVIGVLELNGGRAAQLGIVAGDKVEW